MAIDNEMNHKTDILDLLGSYIAALALAFVYGMCKIRCLAFDHSFSVRSRI